MYLSARELETRYQRAPLLSYRHMLVRHHKQRLFHEAGKTHRRRLFLGGNRSGKTTGGVNEARAHAYGYRYWEVPGLSLHPTGDLPPREQIPTQYWTRRADGIPTRIPSVGMVVSGLPRLRGIGETIFPKLFDDLPEALRAQKLDFKVARGAQSVPDWVKFPNGSRILFATEEQDDSSFEGFVLDYAWVDEPIRRSIYNALWTRLMDFQGPIWFTLTPLGAKGAWMYNALYLSPPSDVFITEVSQRDNPGLSEAQIVEFESNGEWTESEKASRLYGRFQILGDRVFERFDPAVHVIPSHPIPRDWVHLLSVDPHHKRPAFMVWLAIDPARETYHCFREWPHTEFPKLRAGGLTPGEYASLIRTTEGRRESDGYFCDPRFGKAEHQRHGFKETSWVELMADYGVEFDANIPNTGDIEYGHQVIQDLLAYDKNFPIGPSNRPRLLIHDCCENVARSFLNYGYIDTDNPIRGLHRKVSEEYKDPIDALRYGVLAPPPVTNKQYRALQVYDESALAAENEV